jgi:5-(carboxyamino)imidazole ribonucleotide synthase
VPGHILLPGVQKLALGGYDGRGVFIIEDVASSHQGFDEHSVLEKKLKLKKRNCSNNSHCT